MANQMHYIDVDGHILEPPNMWKEYIEPEYRDRAVKIDLDDQGLEFLNVDGKSSFFMSGGTLGAIAGIGQDVREHLTPGALTYEASMLLGGYDPHERIKVMDAEGIDVSIMYPSLGLGWEDICSDPKLAAANCRAYNNWLLDFCKPYPNRLIAAAHIPTLDINEGIKEMKRVAALGAKAAMLASLPPNGLPYGSSYYDPLWAEAQDLDFPMTIHPTGGYESIINKFYPDGEDVSTWWIFVTAPDEVKFQFTSLFNGGTFEKFPGLKIVVLESGIGWLVYWIDRMDDKYEVNGFTTPMKMEPSKYFQRQGWIAMDPDERLAKFSIEVLGPEKFLWAYDYPHSDSITEPIRKLNENLASLPEESQRKVAGGNAIDLYHLAA
ncbi:MAG: amidohydrolase [Chloroflexi bacterium]|nr:amidohydrolase [Chloroflexota bacterium]